MAFGKKNAELRKDWINAFEDGTSIDYNQKNIRYKDFVNKELILFSMYDNMRSIPSVCDGFKPAQRKIIYCCFKRNLVNEIKVAQLSGYVSEHSAYHHGEQSLASTIVGMAQNFVGSNNINLLEPIGQFGSRHMGGKEAASARYIYTKMSELTRCIFRVEDDPLMKQQIEEGQKIEPEWYLPIIPMILVNGAEGIGTGWRSTIPNYNPREIVDNIKRKLHGGEFRHMVPWFKNYKGAIIPNEEKNEKGFICYGIIEVKDSNTVVIKELPIRRWTRDYKTFLEEHVEGYVPPKEPKEKKKEGKKVKKARDGAPKQPKKPRKGVKKEEKKDAAENPEGEERKSQRKKKEPKKKEANFTVEDIREYHAGNDILFEVKIKPEELTEIQKAGNADGLMKTFRLYTSLPTTQFVCFDFNKKLRKYRDELEILEEFFVHRLAMYTTRKDYQLKELKRELAIIDNKVKFVIGVIENQIIINKKRRRELVMKLFEMKFTPYSQFGEVKNISIEEKVLVVQGDENEENKEENKVAEPEEGKLVRKNNKEDEEDKGLPVQAKDYDYLLKLPLWSLTYERVESLLKEKQDKEKIIDDLSKKSESQLWEEDLDHFLAVLEKVEKEEEDNEKKAKQAAPVKRLSKSHSKRRVAKKPAKTEGLTPMLTGKKEEKKTTKRGGGRKKKVEEGLVTLNLKEGTKDKIVESTIKKSESQSHVEEYDEAGKMMKVRESTVTNTVSIARAITDRNDTTDYFYDVSDSDSDNSESYSDSDSYNSNDEEDSSVSETSAQ